jgi:hypothetical protein
MSKDNRNTIFSGKFKLYSKEFIKDMATTGDKIGPGPATINIRDVKPMIKKPCSMARDRRHIGEPNPSAAFLSAPGSYERLDIQDGNKIRSRVGKFGTNERDIDMIRYAPGQE